MTKEELRKIFKKKRSSLSQSEVTEKSRLINQNFIEKLLPKIYKKNSGKIFSIYLASSNEVTCDFIAGHFKQNKIRFAYPKITELNQPLEFLENEDDEEFLPNKFYEKILEPAYGKKILPDFLILPLLAFDKNLSRLGMGGGFFDRTILYLKSQKPELVTIGLAYELQRAGSPLPLEENDQKLDFIVTEKSVFSPSQS
jgi:5-formyltetrahydrofolate cyclo-ligase